MADAIQQQGDRDIVDGIRQLSNFLKVTVVQNKMIHDCLASCSRVPVGTENRVPTIACSRTHLAPLFVMSCVVLLMFALYLLFLPPLLPVHTEIDVAAAAPFDYGVGDSSFLPEQPGKPPPLITKYRLFFSILLALE